MQYRLFFSKKKQALFQPTETRGGTLDQPEELSGLSEAWQVGAAIFRWIFSWRKPPFFRELGFSQPSQPLNRRISNAKVFTWEF